jgi:hypothetical protein
MKQLLLVIAAIITLASCNKASKKPLAKINGEELKAKYGIVLSGLQYDGDEEIMARGGSNNRKQKASAVSLSVFTDLSLTQSGGVLTTTLSPNAEWGGVQQFFTIDTTNNGVSVCNWNWSGTTAPASQTCATNGAVFYRSWTSDKVTYDVHLSPFLTVE